MKEYLQSAELVLSQQKSTAQGLSQQEAAWRLQEAGPNRLEGGKGVSLLRRFLGQLADPMIIILLVAAAVSGVTAAYSGDSFADVVIILVVVLINAVLGVFQESKADKAIAALQKMAAATSKTMREGRVTVVPSEELVPGDIVLLEAGDAVPADGRLLTAASLKVEEAALTGESVPVTKSLEALSTGKAQDIPLGDRKNMVYMGSTVAYGRGTAVITATGMQTEMGKIAVALNQAQDEATPLQRKLSQLSRVLSLLVLGICAAIFLLNVVRAYPNITGEGLLDTFMVAVSLAVAAIPEGLAAVVTIVLSMGVTKMSENQAIIRKLTAVETLGCTQIICSDKTGTLTQNKMTVVEHSTSDVSRLALAMALCSDAELDGENQPVGEPTESALVADALSQGLNKSTCAEDYPRVGEAPFDSGRKMMSTIHRTPEGGILQFTKGAPDQVLERCTSYYENGQELPMTEEKRQEILSANKAMADQALRVLLGAQRRWETMPEDLGPENLEQKLCYLGLSGMIDPIRPEVKAAIQECKGAGVRPIMITGDHRDTAVAIAKSLDILGPDQRAITGMELNALSDEDFFQHIEEFSVYARVQPEHKVRIVKAWQKKGCITAMTGDGVNDAPAIKAADIGVGMGITGTDVTKNVADMVLADDNFATIVSAVAEGRRIYDNIRKAIGFLLASNLAEVLSIFLATLLGFTILEPVHLLWINLITDCFPALALGLEQGEKDLMERQPRSASEGVFAGGLGLDVALQGLVVTAITLASYFLGHYLEAGAFEIVNSPDGMTMAFLTLSMVEIFHSFNMRSRRKSLFSLKSHNRWLWGAMVLSLVLTTAVIYVPFLSSAFGFQEISLVEYVVALGLAISIIPIMELAKLLLRRLGK